MVDRQIKDQNKRAEQKIKELTEFIQRFSANASKSKQATSRKKLLDNLQMDTLRISSRRYPFCNFKQDREVGNDVLEVKGISKTINGKKVLADIPVLEFRKKYDVVFVIADVQSFSTTNERNLHWSIPMGPEIPWYAAEKPTVFISVANPFHLYDVPMVPVCINTYNGSREAIRQAVEKITGKSEFKGNSPVDAFCGMWDTRL